MSSNLSLIWILIRFYCRSIGVISGLYVELYLCVDTQCLIESLSFRQVRFGVSVSCICLVTVLAVIFDLGKWSPESFTESPAPLSASSNLCPSSPSARFSNNNLHNAALQVYLSVL